VFGYQVADPERYGVVEFDADGTALSIEEKPERAEIGLCGDRALLLRRRRAAPSRGLVPSARGELEIADLIDALSRGRRAFGRADGARLRLARHRHP
jgi:glucose-1-phosphate thymidylyltransferase